MITVPDDLHLVAESGLVLVHWRQYIQFMNGGWRRNIQDYDAATAGA